MSFSASAQSTAELPPPAITTRRPRRVSRGADEVAHRAGGLVCRKPGQRRTVGTEGAGAGGDDHRPGVDLGALVGAQAERARRAVQRHDPLPQQARRGERGDLAFQRLDQRAGVDRGVGGDVVDRLFRIERGALPARLGQRVDQHRTEFEHAELEGGKQAGGARADDGDVGFKRCGHAASGRGDDHGAAAGDVPSRPVLLLSMRRGEGKTGGRRQADVALACHQRFTATSDQIASTRPNGQAPWRNP